MIARILSDLRNHDGLEVVHLPFFFTKDVGRTRQAGWDKIAELFGVIGRLVRIRAAGAIDLLLYPVGGPQFVPLVRDVCLLPWILLASRKVIFHFHAGGIAETIGHHPWFLRLFVRFLYQKGSAAIVMTQFGRKDAEALGISDIRVVPHTLQDTYDPALTRRGGIPARLLYVGHFSPEKGTPALLEAFAALRRVTGRIACWSWSASVCPITVIRNCEPPSTAWEFKMPWKSPACSHRTINGTVSRGRICLCFLRWRWNHSGS